MSTMVRTDGTPVAERMECWRDLVGQSFVPLDARPVQRRSVDGSITVQHLGAMEVARVAASSHQVVRTPRLIAAASDDYYKFSLQLSGECRITQDGRRTVLRPGDLTIYDTTRPYRMVFEHDFSMLVAMFPRALLRVPDEAIAGVTASRLPGRHGLGALVSAFLPQVLRELDGVSSATAGRLSDHVLDLLTTMFLERSSLHSDDPRPQRNATLLQVKAYVERHLGDPGLTPERIAAANHMSVRSLHHLFDGEEHSVSGFVRERRLENCRRDLESPALLHRPVSAVAARWGLPDAAHFSKVFKAAYGVTPSVHRAAAIGTVPRT